MYVKPYTEEQLIRFASLTKEEAQEYGEELAREALEEQLYEERLRNETGRLAWSLSDESERAKR